MKDPALEPNGVIVPEPARKKGGFKQTLMRILTISGFVLIGIIIGAALLYFLVVMPMNRQMDGLNVRMNSLNSELSANQAASLQKGKALAVCSADLATAKSQIALANKVSYAAQIMYEASSAQQALLTNDTATAGTRLSLAKNYVAKLTPLITDGTDLKGLSVPIEDALTLYQAKPVDAVAKLDTLIKTLHQLIESLQAN